MSAVRFLRGRRPTSSRLRRKRYNALLKLEEQKPLLNYPIPQTFAHGISQIRHLVPSACDDRHVVDGWLFFREAAVHAIVMLLKNSDKRKKTVMKRLSENDFIPSLLSILQEQNEVPRKYAILTEGIWILLKMAKYSSYRSEICDLDGLRIVERCFGESERSMSEMGRRLQRLLTTRGQRLGLVWKSSNKKGKSFRSRIVHKLKKVFRPEMTNTEEAHSGPSTPHTTRSGSQSLQTHHRRSA